MAKTQFGLTNQLIIYFNYYLFIKADETFQNLIKKINSFLIYKRTYVKNRIKIRKSKTEIKIYT